MNTKVPEEQTKLMRCYEAEAAAHAKFRACYDQKTPETIAALEAWRAAWRDYDRAFCEAEGIAYNEDSQ